MRALSFEHDAHHDDKLSKYDDELAAVSMPVARRYSQ